MKKRLFTLLLMTLGVVTACQNNPTTDDSNSAVTIEKTKPDFIEGEDFDENGGADAYAFAGDNPKSRFYLNPDFYHLTSDETLTIIPSFKTMQQTTEWSCGNAVALMTLTHMGKTDLSEWDIAVAMGSAVDEDEENALPGTANNFYEYGTNVEEMYNFFTNLEGFEVIETSYKADYTEEDLVKQEDGLTPSDIGNLYPTFSSSSLYASENSDETSETSYKADYTEEDLVKQEDGLTPSDIGNLYPTFSSSSLYASENSDETSDWVDDAKDSYFVKWLTRHLEAGRPIMVEWGDWDGHWVAIIGYDNNGTPSIGDDTLIFADPYDTSDHWQDGYIMVEWGDWDGHWVAIIGYDNNGTPSIGDDTLIFADPYDTSDHWQDGYTIFPLEKFFYMWQDRKVAPKPYQLQPYIIIDKK